MNEVWNSLALFLVMLMLGSSFVLWFRACLVLRAGRPLVPRETKEAHPWGLLDVIIAIASNILLTGIAGSWLQSAGMLDTSLPLEQMSREHRGTYIIATAIIPLASLVLVVGWLWIRYRSSTCELGLQWRQLMSDVRLGLAAFAMLAPVVYLIQYVLSQQVEYKHPLIEILKADPNPQLLAWCGFAAVISAPLSEEFFFRLLLQSWLARLTDAKDSPVQIMFGGRGDGDAPEKVSPPIDSQGTVVAELSEPTIPPIDFPEQQRDGGNPFSSPTVESPGHAAKGRISREWTTIVGSSLLFALAHYSHGPAPIPLFVFALGLGYLYSRTQRIVPSIILHLLLNLTTMAALALALSQEALP